MFDWQAGLVFGLIIIIAIAVVVFAVVWDIKLQNICLDNGYAERVVIGTKRYCVGVRDGNTVIVPLESLK